MKVITITCCVNCPVNSYTAKGKGWFKICCDSAAVNGEGFVAEDRLDRLFNIPIPDWCPLEDAPNKEKL